MGLQYYDINLGLTSTQKVAAQGRYIYYLKGTTALISGGVTPSAAGNQAIKVQAGQTGNTLILMPGQSYRVPSSDKAPSEWIITNAVGAEAITGQLLIGEGDFQDANTSNTSYVKLDATFANNVKVTNTGAEPIPVTPQGGVMPVSIQNSQIEITNDTGNRIPVSLDPAQSFNTSGPVMSYTNSVAVAPAATSASLLVSAAANINGVIIEQVVVDQNYANLLAKATAPANATDGDLLGFNIGNAAAYTVRQKVAAGKAVYLWNKTAGVMNGYVLYTLL